MVKVIEDLKELSNSTVKINNSDCPDCNCKCDITVDDWEYGKLVCINKKCDRMEMRK